MSKPERKKSRKNAKGNFVAVRLPDDIMTALRSKMGIVQEDMSTVVRMTLREQLKLEKLL